jgi:hypothetical protein
MHLTNRLHKQNNTGTHCKDAVIHHMFKEKFGGDSDPDIQNYFGYRRTFLNKMVRVSPLFPSSWVDFFVAKRRNLFFRGLFNLFYAVIALVLEPLSFFYLMLSAFRNSLTMTLKISLPTFKTKIRERLMSFGSDFS